jgi:glycosyltransferase involved in cell wall biosynthesis
MYNHRKPQILFDARESYRNATGIGIVVRNLATSLEKNSACSSVPRDFHSRTASRSINRSRFTIVGNLLRNLFWKQVYLPMKMFTTGSKVLLSGDAIGPLFSPGKVVLLVHDLIFFRHPEQVNRRWGAYWRAMLPLCLKRADWVIANSEATRRDLVEILKFDSKRVTVAKLGYDRSLFRPTPDLATKEGVRQKYQLPDDFILFVGGIEPRRNIETLLRAVANLRNTRGARVMIAIVGARTEHAALLENIAEECGIGEQISWLGYVPAADLPVLYGLAQVYVYPSLSEGFGLTVLEAMACGCAVICSNIDSLPEVAGDACIQLPPLDTDAFADAIYRVCNDPKTAAEMQQKGLIQADLFSWERMAEIVVSACEAL